jgi:hypothetical protein
MSLRAYLSPEEYISFDSNRELKETKESEPI